MNCSIDPIAGLNPCGEIIGRDFHCNLAEVHLNTIDHEDKDAQYKAFYAVASRLYNTNLCMSATSIRGALIRLSVLASLVFSISLFTRWLRVAQVDDGRTP